MDCPFCPNPELHEKTTFRDELVLYVEDERYQGVLQGMGLAQLDARAHPLVLGTIDAANEPSRRTALRVGRADVGGWVFVPDARTARSPLSGTDERSVLAYPRRTTRPP